MPAQKNGRSVTTTDRPRPHQNLALKDTSTPDDFDFNSCVEAQVNWSIWRTLHAGEFRLARRCRRCGRWLTGDQSRRAGIGAHCAKADR